MGCRGRIAFVAENEQTKKVRSNAHRELCVLAGKWLNNNRDNTAPTCKYVAIELVFDGDELPDVFGWNYWTSVLIEVKVSRSDFLADFKKDFRINPEKGLGEHRYYCCQKGLIAPEELPEKWGLLYEDNGKIIMVREAERQGSNIHGERAIYSSILRREGIKGKLFDYRKDKTK